MTQPPKEPLMRRILSIFRPDVPPENPALAAALKRASRKVARKMGKRRVPAGVAS